MVKPSHLNEKELAEEAYGRIKLKPHLQKIS